MDAQQHLRTMFLRPLAVSAVLWALSVEAQADIAGAVPDTAAW